MTPATENASTDRLLKLSQVAIMANVSPRTVYRDRASGELEVVVQGSGAKRRVRVRLSEARRYAGSDVSPIAESPAGIPRSGIYFIKCGEFIKIGISDNVALRLSSLRNFNPYPIEALGIVPVDSAEALTLAERKYHERFRAYHHHHEWFCDCAEIRACIASEALPWAAREREDT